MICFIYNIIFILNLLSLHIQNIIHISNDLVVACLPKPKCDHIRHEKALTALHGAGEAFCHALCFGAFGHDSIGVRGDGDVGQLQHSRTVPISGNRTLDSFQVCK